jgi:hypothetical protein
MLPQYGNNFISKTAHLRPAYVNSFNLIVEDLMRLRQYVEPTDAHAGVYSHRIYELLLRTCTEWESLCKEVLSIVDPQSAGERTTVKDYKSLEPTLELANAEVGLMYWSPARKLVVPFRGWTTQRPPLPWYQAYNSVKHNRNTEFSKATLENLSLAVAGLFATMERCRWIPASRPWNTGVGGRLELASDAWPLSMTYATT